MHMITRRISRTDNRATVSIVVHTDYFFPNTTQPCRLFAVKHDVHVEGEGRRDLLFRASILPNCEK